MPRSRSPVRNRSRSAGRHRSRSRSAGRRRSRSRGRYDRKREREPREGDRKRPRRNTDEDLKEKKEASPAKPKPQETEAGDKNAGEISLSIEETNKLRISMGLKPLRVTAPKEKEVNLTKTREQVEDDARQKALKDALEKSRQKREYTEKLKGQSLGEMLMKEKSSTLDWVRQSRKKTAPEILKANQDAQSKEYRADELKGLTVAHDVRAFEEGEEVILTLKDQRILTEDMNDVNEGGDELENVHISEADRRQEREERMKRASGPVYSGFDDDEFTTVIGVQAPLKKRLLAQYDEEDDFLAARERKKFALDNNGAVQVEKVVAPVETAKSGSTSLVVNKQQAIEEYFTAEEMAVFAKKQSKKLRKKQKTRKKIVDEDENEATTDNFVEQLEREAASAPQDHGRRSTGASAAAAEEAERRERFENARKRANDRVQAMVERMKNATDDIDEELSESLARSRRVALVAAKEQPIQKFDEAKVVLQLQQATANAGHIHKEDLGENAVVFNEATDFDVRVKNAMEERTARVTSGFESVHKVTEIVEEEVEEEETKEETKEEEEEEEDDNWGVEEPLVQSGMAATLALLRNRGDLRDQIQVRQAGRANDHRERNVEDELLVKDGVKLDYRDEFGRLLTKKEAFRQLSYKFHGHTPGKKKQEKRLKQLKEELAQQKNLGNVAQRMQTLEKRQKAAKQAHVVLSG